MSAESGPKRFLSEVKTRCSIVQAVQSDLTVVRVPGLARFFEHYAGPIAAEIRAFSAWAARDVDDLSGDFVLDLIEKSKLQKYDLEHGRFRDWLKQCLKNFLIDEFRRRIAIRHGIAIEHVSIDATDEDGNRLIDLVDRSERQGSAFDREWALQVVRLSVEALGAELAADGKAGFFAAIRPALSMSGDAEPYAVIAKRLKMTEGALKTAISRLRNERLVALIRSEVRASVGSKADVDNEIRFLMALLEKKGPL